MRRWKRTILAQERNGDGRDLKERRKFNVVLRGGAPFLKFLTGLGALMGGPSETEQIRTKLTNSNFHPIQPLGTGISSEAFEVGKTHPLYPELTEQLGIPDGGRVGVKLGYQPWTVSPEHQENMQTWLDSKRAKPRSIELSAEQKEQLYPTIEPHEYERLYAHLGTINEETPYTTKMATQNIITPAMPHPQTKKHKGRGVEIVEPIATMRNSFEQLIPTDGILGVPAEFLWPVMFMHDIREHFMNMQAHAMYDIKTIISDTHEYNWGLRLRENWVPAVKRLFEPYYGKDGTVDVLTLSNPTYRNTQYTWSHLPKDTQDKFEELRELVYEAMFQTPSEDYDYGPLVVLDSDHVEEKTIPGGEVRRSVYRKAYEEYDDKILYKEHKPYLRVMKNRDKAILEKCGYIKKCYTDNWDNDALVCKKVNLECKLPWWGEWPS